MNESKSHSCRGGNIIYLSCKFCRNQNNKQIQLESLGNKPPPGHPAYVYEGGVREGEES